jgi:hypothetical protein
MSYTLIRNALELHLSTIVSAPIIVWENEDYDSSSGTPYIHAQLRPLVCKPESLGQLALTQYEGGFQIDLNYPLNQGPQSADVIADQIVGSLFKWGTILTTDTCLIRVLRSERSGPVFNDTWYRVPISVQWYAYLSSTDPSP